MIHVQYVDDHVPVEQNINVIKTRMVPNRHDIDDYDHDIDDHDEDEDEDEDDMSSVSITDSPMSGPCLEEKDQLMLEATFGNDDFYRWFVVSSAEHKVRRKQKTKKDQAKKVKQMRQQIRSF